MKLYTRREMTRLASICVAGIATGGLAFSPRMRNLLAQKNISFLKGVAMKTFTVPSYIQYSTGVAEYIDSLGLSGNGIIFVKSMNTTVKGYHFLLAKIANGKVVRDMWYVRLNGTSTNMETRAYASNNDARLESGAVLAFIPVEIDW